MEVPDYTLQLHVAYLLLASPWCCCHLPVLLLTADQLLFQLLVGGYPLGVHLFLGLWCPVSLSAWQQLVVLLLLPLLAGQQLRAQLLFGRQLLAQLLRDDGTQLVEEKPSEVRAPTSQLLACVCGICQDLACCWTACKNGHIETCQQSTSLSKPSSAAGEKSVTDKPNEQTGLIRVHKGNNSMSLHDMDFRKHSTDACKGRHPTFTNCNVTGCCQHQQNDL